MAADIPEEHFDGGVVKVVSGVTDAGTTGAVARAPLYLDIHLNGSFTQVIPAADNGFIYVLEGEVNGVSAGHVGILGGGHAKFMADNAQFLLIAGARLEEPVARAGPFVMNTRAELLQAFDDYKSGRF